MAPSGKLGKATRSRSTHDHACTHCRERKIRCGREKPYCANCKRDGVECGYSKPAKRVNHIKLLCDNVQGLEDRMNNIEAGLSSMGALLQTNGFRKLLVETAVEEENLKELSAYSSLRADSTCLPPIDSHIVRDGSNLTDLYHGPCTLFALCSEFRDTVSSVQSMQDPTSANDGSQRGKRHNRSAMIDAAKNLLDQVCLDAGIEESVDPQMDPAPIRLPPKQLLLMAQTQFFQHTDYATDLFVQSNFRSNMERVYSRPFALSDEPWAICFNAIILLVLGHEGLTQNWDPQIVSEFVRPCLLTLRSALCNPRGLMIAKTVNVQALALLSIAAQMYYPLGFAESIFAQACVLAKTMGLHQARPAPEGASSGETQERFKVFRSLYLRDKSSSILRGSICWLPGLDCSLSSELGGNSLAGSKSAVRFQLAGLEDEVYRLLHPPKQASAQRRGTLLHLAQGLEDLANANAVFSLPYAGTRNVDLQLEFLAARICILRMVSEPGYIRRALSDSRASCLLIVISCGKHDPSMVEQLDTLLLSMSSSNPLSRGIPGKASSIERTTPETGDSVPLLSNNILDAFSITAFFLLAMNVVWPSSAYDVSNAEEDLNLLKSTCACFKDFDAKIQANNYTHKVRLALESLLEVVTLIKASHQLQCPNDHDTCTGIPLSEQHRPLDFSRFPNQSASSMPAVPWASSSSKNTLVTTPDSLSTGTSLGLLTPIDSYYQPYDTLQPNLFSHHVQQQAMQLPRLTRPHISGSDVFIDEHDGSIFM